MKITGGWVLAGGLSLLGGCFNPDASPETDEASAGTSEGGGGETTSTVTPGTEPPLPTGVTTPGTSTAEPDSTATDDPDSTATDDPVECVGNGIDPTCPAAAPFCEQGVCVDCTSAPAGACQAADPTTPVCDTGRGECAACVEHDQCESRACRFTTGECFAARNRLWVDNTFGGCAGGVGTEDNPLCTVVEAMEIINDQAGMEPWAIIVAGSPTPYLGTVDPDNNRPVAIIGPDGGIAATLAAEQDFAVDLWAQSPETYLHRLTIERDFGGPTIRCATGQVYVTDSNLRGGETTATLTGGSMRLRRVSVNTNGMGMIVRSGGELLADQAIFDNSSGGIAIDGGRAELRRSVVSNNYVEGGIRVQAGGELTLTNSMVFYNQYQNDGILVGDGATATLVHSTVIGSLECRMGFGPVSVRNSIVVGQGFEAGMTCAGASVDRSVVNLGDDQGMGNVVATADDLGAIFVNPGVGMDADWHVLPGSTPDGVAVHQAGDPVVDFDGDPRPVMVGAMDYAGADVP